MRQKIIFLTMTVATLFAGVSPSVARADVAPARFYRSLANAVDTVQGNSKLSLYEGTFRSGTAGEPAVEWSIEDDTDAFAYFYYANSALQSVELKFTHPVQMRTVTAPSVCLKFTRIKYDAFGGITEWDYSPCDQLNEPDRRRGRGTIKSHLRVDTSASRLFLVGNMQASDVSLTAVSGEALESRAKSIFKRVEFAPQGDRPALEITLKEARPIYLDGNEGTQPGSGGNYLKTAGGCVIKLQHVVYNVEANRIWGDCDHAALNFSAGRVATGPNGVVLDFAGDGCSLSAGAIHFDNKDPGTNLPMLRCSATLDAKVSSGKFHVTKAQTALDLDIAPESTVTLVNWELTVYPGSIGVAFDTGSSLTLQLGNSILPTGKFGYVGLSGGFLKIGNVRGQFSTSGTSSLFGTIDILRADINDGDFRVNSASSCKLTGGNIIASFLTIDTSRPNSGLLFGPISEFAVDLGDSVIEQSQGLQIILTSGKLRAKNTLAFTPAAEFPVGGFRLVDLKVKKLSSTRLQGFSAAGGTLNAALNIGTDGVITSPYVVGEDHRPIVKDEDKLSYLGGSMKFSAVAQSGAFGLNVSLTDGILSPHRPEDPSIFSGKISGEITAFSAALRTPSMGIPADGQHGFDWDGDGQNNEEARNFSISGSVALDESPVQRSFGPSEITITGNDVSFGTVLKPRIRLHIDNGGGEHSDRDHPDTGGFESNEWKDKKAQEVFFDKFGDGPLGALVRFHVYALPGDYILTPEWSLSWVGSAPVTKLTALGIDPPMLRGQAWDRDGGQGLLFMAKVLTFVANKITLNRFRIGGVVSEAEGRLDGYISGLFGSSIERALSQWRPNP